MPSKFVSYWKNIDTAPEGFTQKHMRAVKEMVRKAFHANIHIEWQPIKTAPKDGTQIIIYKKGWDQAPVAYWGEYPDNPIEDANRNHVYMCGWNFTEWVTLGMDDGFLGWQEDIVDDVMPDFWMPLPDGGNNKCLY